MRFAFTLLFFSRDRGILFSSLSLSLFILIASQSERCRITIGHRRFFECERVVVNHLSFFLSLSISTHILRMFLEIFESEDWKRISMKFASSS